jgi:hypothetical protein
VRLPMAPMSRDSVLLGHLAAIGHDLAPKVRFRLPHASRSPGCVHWPPCASDQLVCSCPATAYGRWRGCAFGGYLYPFIPLKAA